MTDTQAVWDLDAQSNVKGEAEIQPNSSRV